MIDDTSTALDNFVTDPVIDRVVLRSNYERAFCTGGDLRRIWGLSLAGHYAEAKYFFQTKYALNLRISTYPNPYISLIYWWDVYGRWFVFVGA